jgi:hypothetical protein
MYGSGTLIVSCMRLVLTVEFHERSVNPTKSVITKPVFQNGIETNENLRKTEI